MNLVYIGDHFYRESKTIMSPIYTEDGERSDWGFVQNALERGEEIHIRQATQHEKDFYEAKLQTLQKTFKRADG